MAGFIKNARDAEHAAARSMKSLGFTDATVTPIGPDAGIDVTSRAALAQVKWKGGAAGRPDLQRLYGASAGQHHKTMLFYSASGYSKSAVEYADRFKIALFDYDPHGTAEPQNSVAANLVSKPPQTEPADQSKPTSPPFRPKSTRAQNITGEPRLWTSAASALITPKPKDERPSTQNGSHPQRITGPKNPAESWRDEVKMRNAEPPGPIASMVLGAATILLCLSLAVLAGWLSFELYSSTFPTAVKIILGTIPALGGLTSFAIACVGVREIRTPATPSA
ncbi:restriction endonuclease [Rhodococcoides fascians]|uniref:restriction endonuclease n=1 Tax=Rhodococcoides fascians TaxID=1828 RepID=UPI00068D1B61|nr:restriction endonuclease [Rhodococcus fascians]AMY56480.1 hypothetical protein A3L23_05182 [Rhodococcus fascians D188]